MHRIFFHTLVTCLLLSLSGCHATLHPEPPINPDTVNAQYMTPKSIPDTIRLITKVDYVDGKNNKRVVGQDLVISAQTPRNMRITISAFDKAVSSLVTDGDKFVLMDVGSNTIIAGKATPDNISQILPVFLSASDLYRVICGGYPTDGLIEDSTQEFAWDPIENGYKRKLSMKDGASLEVFHAYPDGEIFKIVVKQDDKVNYEYRASDFENTSSGWKHPKSILFSLPEFKTNVRLRVENTETDVQFSDAVFRLIPPENAKFIYLE